MPEQADTTQETVAATPEVVNYSKPSMEAPKLPNVPSINDKDLHFKSRQAKLRAIQDQLNVEDDQEVSAKKREIYSKKSEVKAEADEESEETVTKAPSKEELEKKRDERAAKLAAEEKAKLKKEAAEEKDEDTSETASEDQAQETPVEAKKEDELTKLEKERRAKLEKVLAMEAKAQKERQRLAGLEARLAEREKEVQNAYKRAQAQLDEQAKRYEGQVRMAQRILQLAKEAPLTLLEEAGQRPEDVANWIQAASDPTQQRMKELERRIAEKEQAEHQARQREQQLINQRNQEQNLRAVEQQFLSNFDEKDAEGNGAFEAAITMYSPRELVRLGHEIANEAIRNGYSFTHRDIAEAVNALAMEEPRYKKIQERLSGATAKANPVKEEVKAAEKATEAPAPKAQPKTTTVLTNSAVQQASKPAAKQSAANYKRIRESRIKRILSGLDE